MQLEQNGPRGCRPCKGCEKLNYGAVGLQQSPKSHALIKGGVHLKEGA